MSAGIVEGWGQEGRGCRYGAQGASVTLFKDSEKLDETSTDNFGDFKFDNLQENSGKYTLEILFEDYERKIIEVELKESLNIGNICLEEK